MTNEKIYLLTDGCVWEINKQTGNEHPHSIEVVDLETGAIRYIRSGSRIKFIEGEISDLRSQEAYNKISGQMPGNSKNKQNGRRRKEKREKQQTIRIETPGL